MKEPRENIRALLIQTTNIPPQKLRLPDRHYILPSVVQVRDHMENVEVKPYRPEAADCDNRALRLTAHFSGLGFAFGWASIGEHDICVFLSDTLQVWYVEPSTCLIYPPDQDLSWAVFP